MPVTPARAQREAELRDAKNAEQRKASEAKATEFRMNCDAGVVGACTALGEWLELMHGDFAGALELYRPACRERGYAQACFQLGRMLVRGKPGVDAAPGEARTAFATACAGGNAPACFEAARMRLADFRDAQPPSAPPAPGTPAAAPAPLPPHAQAALSDAVGFAARGCAIGSSNDRGNCCFMLAQVRMGPLPLADGGVDGSDHGGRTRPGARSGGGGGGGGDDDDERGMPLPARLSVRALLERGCDAEHPASCGVLSTLLRDGSARLGVARDAEAAAAIARRGLQLSGLSERQADRQLRLLAVQKAAAVARGGGGDATAAGAP